MKDKIVVVFSSHRDDEANQKFTNHIAETIGVENHMVACYVNHNQYGLPEIYNKAILEYQDWVKDSVFVFCHNDIQIKTKDWGKVLLNIFNKKNFQIIGVAGSTYLPASGRWWEDRSKMHGVVEHTNGVSNWVSEYSPPKKGYVKPVVLIDGLFMAADISNLLHNFDENFKGFHFYDLPFCVENYYDDCEIGVTTDIRILHESVGMTNDQWEQNRQQFADKYKFDLPLTYEK